MSVKLQPCASVSIMEVTQQEALLGQSVDTDTSNAGLMVTKLMTRPKTSFAGRPTSLRYIYGSKSSSALLGEKLTPERTRPKSCVPRRKRDSERPASSSKERSVPREAKELSLPICTTRATRFTGAEKEILAITTPTRRWSSAGGRRAMSSLLASRDRSAALLRELSVSLSLTISKSGPAPGVQDSVKEKWSVFSKEDLALTGIGQDRRSSTSKDASESEGDVEASPSSVKELSTPKREFWGPMVAPVYLFKQPGSENYTPPSSAPGRESDSAANEGPLSGAKEPKATDNRPTSPSRSGRYKPPTLGYTWPVNRTPRAGSGAKNQRPLNNEAQVCSPRIITINRTASPTRDAPATPRATRHKNLSAEKAGKPLSADPCHPAGASYSLHVEDPALSRCSSNEKVDSASVGERSPSNVTTFDKAIFGVEERLSPPLSVVCDTTDPVSVREDTVLARVFSVDESPSISSSVAEAFPALIPATTLGIEKSTPVRNDSDVEREMDRDVQSCRPVGSGKSTTVHTSLPPTPSIESSSSTPTVPFSSSELLYGNDVTSRHQVGSDDVLAGELGTWGGDKQKLKELEVGNRRPTSRNSTSRKVPNFDKVAFDRDREELRPIANSLPPKQNPLRANGRDEDLVAMGTLWSPSQLQARGSSTATSSSKSTSATNSASGGVEPKYSDPLVGAPPTFQQRLMELAALEAETVRWERTKKVKKKPKQDRDS
ncbi:hypothetical protein BaRGS_00007552 [Batillaria attramentaria]|uniref:Proteophosphoglycan ppg4 n=1 Tax=Batillaria attramentaria TaxID=370345 RepID=A0ABD0LP09_9CAEN